MRVIAMSSTEIRGFLNLVLKPMAAIAILATPTSGFAQAPSEVEIDQSAAKDLYVSRRPPVPDSPKIPKELQSLLEKKEKQADEKRDEAIGLLRTFLKSKPVGESRAEGLFKLAELLWEDSRRQYILATDVYERKLERCRQTPAACEKPPKEPELDFSEPEGTTDRFSPTTRVTAESTWSCTWLGLPRARRAVSRSR